MQGSIVGYSQHILVIMVLPYTATVSRQLQWQTFTLFSLSCVFKKSIQLLNTSATYLIQSITLIYILILYNFRKTNLKKSWIWGLNDKLTRKPVSYHKSVWMKEVKSNSNRGWSEFMIFFFFFFCRKHVIGDMKECMSEICLLCTWNALRSGLICH